MNAEVEPLVTREAIAKPDHLAELPRRVDVEEWKGKRAGRERLLRQSYEDGGVLSDRVEHHRPFELGDDLAEDADALCLEEAEMRGGASFGS